MTTEYQASPTKSAVTLSAMFISGLAVLLIALSETPARLIDSLDAEMKIELGPCPPISLSDGPAC